MELSSIAQFRAALLRLVGTDDDDPALTSLGEGTNEVVYLFLTRGARNAQRWMIDQGFSGWRKRSAALSWSGADATDGGRYSALPSDFLRAYGTNRPGESPLVEANGRRWGQGIQTMDGDVEGDYHYFVGDELWLTRKAQPPTTLYLLYHYTHPIFDASITTFDFPVDGRFLIVAEAANVAKEENWLPLGPEGERKIERALVRAREEARQLSRGSKQPKQFRRPPRFANRY